MQPNQPAGSGQPKPVSGVTGGPPVLGGAISQDPNDGSIVLTPNPANAVQIKKGANPQSLQLYEFFNTNSNYSRLALNAQAGGPFQISVETQPVITRDLQILASGRVIIPNLNITNFIQAITTGGMTAGQWTDLPASTVTLQAGLWLITAELFALVGTALSTVQVQVAPASTGTSGTPATLTGVAAITITNASANEILTLLGIANIATAGQYKIQAFLSGGVGNAGGRWSGVKVG